MDLLSYARAIAERIEAESAKTKVPVAVCVIDVHGNVILKHRMSGAPTFSLELSERKAYTSALVGLRTADLSPMVQPGQALFPLMGVAGGRFCSMGGGAPLTIDGQLVAGIGISGGWVFQEITARLTGHIEDGDESFTPELTDVVRRAEAAARASAGPNDRAAA